VVRALQQRTRDMVEAAASRSRSRGLVRVASIHDAHRKALGESPLTLTEGEARLEEEARADELARDVLDLVSALEAHGGA
jgi:hypothetical protein